MNRRKFLATSVAAFLATPALLRHAQAQEGPFRVKYFPVASGSGSHDTAAAPDEVSALTAQAELTRAGLPQMHRQMQQAEHLLAVLAGRPPAQGVPAFTLAEFSLPDRLPVSVPSEWARRRPDILAAEAGLRAAHAELGVTFARQYPQLNLSASLGSQALTTSALFGGAAAMMFATDPAQQAEWNRIWVHELQPQLARLSTRGRQVVADSGHMIPFEAPGAVVQAVEEVLKMIAASAKDPAAP